MRKINKIILAILSTISVAGFAVGITYAAYNAPPESTTYEFGSMTAGNYNFKPLSYYFDSGQGTERSPYIIKNSQQLRNLSKIQNSGMLPAATYVSLGSSFQYEGDNLEPIGTTTYPFTGVFNGNSYLITGLKVYTETLTNVGMFGVIGTNSATGTVHSLVLAGPSVKYNGGAASVNIGIVAGYKNTTEGHVSVVNNIEIYGGTANFDKVRAHLYSTGTPTFGNTIVGSGGSATSGYVSVLSSTPSYSSTATPSGVTAASTNYYIYHNGSGAVETHS